VGAVAHGQAVGQHADHHPGGPGGVARPAHDGGGVAHRDRPAAQGVDQPAPALAVGALEPRLAGPHPGRSVGGVGRRQPGGGPGTPGPRRAGPAGRGSAQAHGGPQLHDRLVPGPRPPGRDQCVGPSLRLRRAQRPSLPPGQDPPHVGVHHAHVLLEGEGQDRPGGVGADAGQRPQGGEVGRQLPAVALDHHLGGPMEADGPAVVPEASPASDHLPHRRRRTGRRRRERGQERPVVRHHPVHAGLLGHDLGDQYGPRVAGRPPRQRPQVTLAPVDQPGQWYTRVT
jgi:hypothetical protein